MATLEQYLKFRNDYKTKGLSGIYQEEEDQKQKQLQAQQQSEKEKVDPAGSLMSKLLAMPPDVSKPSIFSQSLKPISTMATPYANTPIVNSPFGESNRTASSGISIIPKKMQPYDVNTKRKVFIPDSNGYTQYNYVPEGQGMYIDESGNKKAIPNSVGVMSGVTNDQFEKELARLQKYKDESKATLDKYATEHPFKTTVGKTLIRAGETLGMRPSDMEDKISTDLLADKGYKLGPLDVADVGGFALGVGSLGLNKASSTLASKALNVPLVGGKIGQIAAREALSNALINPTGNIMAGEFDKVPQSSFEGAVFGGALGGAMGGVGKGLSKVGEFALNKNLLPKNLSNKMRVNQLNSEINKTELPNQYIGFGDNATGQLKKDLIKQRLGELYDSSIADPLSKGKLYLNKITPKQAQLIKEQTGFNVEDFQRQIDSDAIRHIDSQHGNNKEVLRGQKPITKQDFIDLVDILENINSAKFSPDKVGKKALEFNVGQNSDMTYVDSIGGKNNNGKLLTKTMWKKLPSSTANESPLTNAQNGGSNVSSINNSILKNGENINTNIGNANKIKLSQEEYSRLSINANKGTINQSYNSKGKSIPPSKELPLNGENNQSKIINTIQDLPNDEIGLTNFINQQKELQKQGIKINLQLFSEAQARLKNRQFAENSIMNSPVIPQAMKEEISKNMPTYEPITNKETWNAATEKVNANLNDSINEWKAMDSVKSADDTALGQALMVDAIKKGDVTGANEIAYDLAEKLTKAGQSVQAASILKRLSPEGMLTYVNRNLQRAEKELGDRFKGKLKLTPEESSDIVQKMESIKNMPDGIERDIEFAKIQKLVSEKIPPTTKEKLKALQRINLLFNPKTMIRNVTGNIIFSGINNAKDLLRSELDKGVSLFTKERTALAPSIKTQLQGAGKGIKQVVSDYKLGIDTTNMPTQFELNSQRVGSPFKSKLFKTADNLTRTGLKLGDTPFYRGAYEDSLRQQMKLKGLTEPTPEMKLFAENVAKERTFQDTNKFTEFFDGVRNGLNKVGFKGFGLGDVILPFTKTPANILKAGVEYSPLNVISVANNAIKLAKEGGSTNQYKLVDSLSKTLTGSGLLAAGMYLAQNGIITGSSPKDADASAFQKEQGILPYALKLGKDFVSFDWAQPASIPIAMGADIYNNYKNSKNTQDAIISGAKGGLSTLFSQSMVQGLQKLFSSYDSSGNGLLDNLEGAGYNAILQLLPFNSLTRQVAEIIDPVKRSTYEDTGIESKLINQAKNSLPFLRQTLPEKIKTTGEADTSRNFANVLFNPANVGINNLDNTKKEILRLYNDSGETIQFPKVASKTITPLKQGKQIFEKLTLDGTQRSEYQKLLGAETMKLFNDAMNLSKYKNADDSEKAKILQGVITDADKKAKELLVKQQQLIKIPKAK